MTPIETRAEFFRALREGRFTSLGSYPLFFVTRRGSALSPDYARANALAIGREFRRPSGYEDPASGIFRVIGAEVNWEDPELFCAGSEERIPSAYAEPDDDEGRGTGPDRYPRAEAVRAPAPPEAVDEALADRVRGQR